MGSREWNGIGMIGLRSKRAEKRERAKRKEKKAERKRKGGLAWRTLVLDGGHRAFRRPVNRIGGRFWQIHKVPLAAEVRVRVHAGNVGRLELVPVHVGEVVVPQREGQVFAVVLVDNALVVLERLEGLLLLRRSRVVAAEEVLPEPKLVRGAELSGVEDGVDALGVRRLFGRGEERQGACRREFEELHHFGTKNLGKSSTNTWLGVCARTQGDSQ